MMKKVTTGGTWGYYTGFLRGNSLTGTVPSELGLMTGFEYLFCMGETNSLSGSIPSQLGNLVELTTAFYLNQMSLTSTIPTELGKFTKLRTYMGLFGNSLSSSIPTQLGLMSEMASHFYLMSNKLCSDVPTQVQALSSSVTENWCVTTDNSLGTVCGWQSYMADERFPALDGSNIKNGRAS